MTRITMAGLITLALMPMLAVARDYHGVNWNAVDWKRLCAAVKPLKGFEVQ